MFDHYCPFVDNTVGLNNYKWFLSFLISINVSILSFIITFVIYLRRYWRHNDFPWVTFFAGLIISVILFPVATMLIYHAQLTMVNLTTNEHMNIRKYKYFYPKVDGKRQYKNPWYKGWMGNAMEKFFPTERSYTLPEEHASLLGNPLGRTSDRGLELT